MTASTYIARILGPVLVIIGLGLLLEGETFRAMAGEFLRERALIYFSGVATLAVGPCHPQCASSLDARLAQRHHRFRLALVIGGIFRILAPTMVQTVGESFIAHRRWPIWAPSSPSRSAAFLSVMGYQDIWDGKRRVHHRTSAAKSAGAASRSAKRPRRKVGRRAVAQTINSA